MTGSECRSLGAGTYGSCCKTRNPRTGEELMIKVFPVAALDDFLIEAENLKALQHLAGVQRLTQGYTRI